MNKCRHCGVLVPIEKAFCPNCSEPIEPEEAPHRLTTSSSDMMATLRDEPEHYADLLQTSQKKSPAPPVATEAQMPQSASALRNSSTPQPAQEVGKDSSTRMATPLPPVKSNNRLIIIALFSVLVLLFVFLMVFKIL
jgi:hypothetical protein